MCDRDLKITCSIEPFWNAMFTQPKYINVGLILLALAPPLTNDKPNTYNKNTRQSQVSRFRPSSGAQHYQTKSLDNRSTSLGLIAEQNFVGISTIMLVMFYRRLRKHTTCHMVIM